MDRYTCQVSAQQIFPLWFEQMHTLNSMNNMYISKILGLAVICLSERINGF